MLCSSSVVSLFCFVNEEYSANEENLPSAQSDQPLRPEKVPRHLTWSSSPMYCPSTAAFLAERGHFCSNHHASQYSEGQLWNLAQGTLNFRMFKKSPRVEFSKQGPSLLSFRFTAINCQGLCPLNSSQACPTIINT